MTGKSIHIINVKGFMAEKKQQFVQSTLKSCYVGKPISLEKHFDRIPSQENKKNKSKWLQDSSVNSNKVHMLSTCPPLAIFKLKILLRSTNRTKWASKRTWKAATSTRNSKSTLFTLKEERSYGLGIWLLWDLQLSDVYAFLEVVQSYHFRVGLKEMMKMELMIRSELVILFFDKICSSTPYWIPFYADGSPYGIILKQVDNTLYFAKYSKITLSFSGNQNSLKDSKIHLRLRSTSKFIHRFDLDTKIISPTE